MKKEEKPTTYGLMAEFESPADLMAAAERTRDEGYRATDAYTPFPIHGLPELVGYPRKPKLSLMILIGGLVGCFAGYFMQYFACVLHYPLNIGGRPLNSWPSFMPITFEVTVLFAAFTAVLGMLGLNGLPMPYHPVFNVPAFVRASQDRFFLCIEATDEKFDLQETREFLESLGPVEVSEVEP